MSVAGYIWEVWCEPSISSGRILFRSYELRTSLNYLLNRLHGDVDKSSNPEIYDGAVKEISALIESDEVIEGPKLYSWEFDKDGSGYTLVRVNVM